MTVIKFYNKNQKCVSCTEQRHFFTRLKFLVPLSIFDDNCKIVFVFFPLNHISAMFIASTTCVLITTTLF